jgi:hypothetical protein
MISKAENTGLPALLISSILLSLILQKKEAP